MKNKYFLKIVSTCKPKGNFHRIQHLNNDFRFTKGLQIGFTRLTKSDFIF